MTKKFKEETWHIRILNLEGKNKIEELIKSEGIKIDQEYIELMAEKNLLTDKLVETNDQLEFYLRKKLLE